MSVRMNIEMTDLDMILNHLETTSLEPHDDYSSELTYKDQKILYKYIKQLQQENKQLKEVIDKAIEKINDYKIYCEENKGFTEYTDIEIEAIEPVISKFEDILNEVSE